MIRFSETNAGQVLYLSRFFYAQSNGFQRFAKGIVVCRRTPPRALQQTEHARREALCWCLHSSCSLLR